MMETRPIAVETHVSGRRRTIALSESQREPTDWDRRIHGDPRRAYAGEVVHGGPPLKAASATQRTNMRNPVWSPTTVMCPLQGEVSSNRNTLPGGRRLVSPSVVVMEKIPCRTMPN